MTLPHAFGWIYSVSDSTGHSTFLKQVMGQMLGQFHFLYQRAGCISGNAPEEKPTIIVVTVWKREFPHKRRKG
jgi:hypothetical protein